AVHPRFKYLLRKPNYVTRCHAHSLAVNTWTVNEVTDIKKMIEFGVDAVISNYPNRMAQVQEILAK
ncbi:MAG TPA: glycerophosphodiester phosphodiesterase, partial [Clostridiaceae bacterium]|nr:glycerophosphodiester phosphodiesterase [Clostridiaceae bacterium]